MNLEAFIGNVHGDLAHRKKELSQIKLSIQSTQDEDILSWTTRAATVLSYAHWEGFIKIASMKYLTYLNAQNLPVSTLKACLQAATVMSHFKQAEGTSKTGHLAQLLIAMDDERSGAFKVNPKKVVNTEHNLSSTVYISILTGIGIQPSDHFATRAGFIDATLLNGRNQVAHGELVAVETSEAIERVEGVLVLLDDYADQVIDAATRRAYLS